MKSIFQTTINYLKKEEGAALFLSVLILSLLLALGASIFQRQFIGLQMNTKEPKSLMAAFAADAGLEYALYKYRKITGTLPNTCSPTNSGSCDGDDEDLVNGYYIGQRNLENGSSYYVIVPRGDEVGPEPDGTDYVNIRSIGFFQGISRSFELTIYTARP